VGSGRKLSHRTLAANDYQRFNPGLCCRMCRVVRCRFRPRSPLAKAAAQSARSP